MTIGLLLFVLSVGVIGCKKLPNPETDEVTRMLWAFDALHRPGGRDLPVERYWAWASQRAGGLSAPDKALVDLQRLVDEQMVIVKKIRAMSVRSDHGLRILGAYLAPHVRGHEALEEALAGTRMKDPQRVAQAERDLQAVLDQLRAAREVRKAITVRLGLPVEAKDTPK